MKGTGAHAGGYNAEVPKKKGGDESLRIRGDRAAGEHGAVVLVIADTEGKREEHKKADNHGKKKNS